MNGMQVNIPDVVSLQLTARDVSTILEALQGHGPFKVVVPVLQSIEQQLLSQQVRAAAPPAAPLPSLVEAVAAGHAEALATATP
jgi:hypothetical protein